MHDQTSDDSPDAPFGADGSLDSVDGFLRRIRSAKAVNRRKVDDFVEPLLDDASSFAMPPAMAPLLNDAIEAYGDETFKQVAIVVLGQWVNFHKQWLDEHIKNNSVDEALFTMSDLTKISHAIQLISDIGSFGGDEDYRKGMRKQIGQALLENIEEKGGGDEALDELLNDGLF